MTIEEFTKRAEQSDNETLLETYVDYRKKEFGALTSEEWKERSVLRKLILERMAK